MGLRLPKVDRTRSEGWTMVDLLLGLVFHPSLVERPGRILLLAAVLAILGLLAFVARLLGAERQRRIWP